jgi:hypothetical protein
MIGLQYVNKMMLHMSIDGKGGMNRHAEGDNNRSNSNSRLGNEPSITRLASSIRTVEVVQKQTQPPQQQQQQRVATATITPPPSAAQNELIQLLATHIYDAVMSPNGTSANNSNGVGGIGIGGNDEQYSNYQRNIRAVYDRIMEIRDGVTAANCMRRVADHLVHIHRCQLLTNPSAAPKITNHDRHGTLHYHHIQPYCR